MRVDSAHGPGVYQLGDLHRVADRRELAYLRIGLFVDVINGAWWGQYNGGEGRMAIRFSLMRLLIVAVVLLGATAAFAKHADLVVPLQFTPTTATNEESPTLSAKALERTFRLEVADARNESDKSLIGDATDDDDSHFAVKTPTDVSAFASETFLKLTSGWGLRLDPKAELVVTVAIARWFISETNQAVGSSYAADVTLRGELRDPSGATVWRGTAQGDARRYGKAQSIANYNEVSSDGAAEALAKLFSDPAFQAALEGKTSQAAPTNASTGGETTLTPDALLQQLVELAKNGFSQDFLISVVKQKTLKPGLTTPDMVKWKEAGIPEPVISAANARGA